MMIETLAVVAVTALATGLGTGAGVAFSTWIIQRHVIHRMDRKQEEKK